jgi:hypothetical protein
MNWADECDNPTSSVQDFLARFPPNRQGKHLQTEADRLFADIVDDEFSHRSLDASTREDDIYAQLLCAQIARAEARDIARATVFDYQSSLSGQIHLPEPTDDLLEFCVPKDIANYQTPVTGAPPSQKMSTEGRNKRNWNAPPSRQPQHRRATARSSPPTKGPHRAKNRHPPSRSSYGVDPSALIAAQQYLHLHGNAARHISQRAVLERDIRDKMASTNWTGAFPPTNKILFAMAHGLKVLRVRGGRTLEWNRFRDNQGNKLR